MDWKLKQSNLQIQKIELNRINTSVEGGELFLKVQSFTVVNLIRDLDPSIGLILKNNIDSLWNDFYKANRNWKPKDTYGGASSVEKKRQWTIFKAKSLQRLHLDICEAVQNAIDVGELLE